MDGGGQVHFIPLGGRGGSVERSVTGSHLKQTKGAQAETKNEVVQWLRQVVHASETMFVLTIQII